MVQKKSLKSRLKNKNFLWYTGVLLLLLGIFGIGYGIDVCYNGILIKDTTDEALLTLLENNRLTVIDGVYAFIGFGSIIIIYYLLLTGLGAIGILSSGRILVKQTIFWFSIILLTIAVIFGVSGILSWTFVAITLICLSFYIIAVFRKYNIDLEIVEKKESENKQSELFK